LKSKRHEKAEMTGGAHRIKAKSSLYQTGASKNLSNEEEGSRLKMHVQDEVIDDYNDYKEDVEEIFESLNGKFWSHATIAFYKSVNFRMSF
jgi:archaellum component FlaC